MPKKKITKEQLEKYILECIKYRDGYSDYIERIQGEISTLDGSNPPTQPPKPPILK